MKKEKQPKPKYNSLQNVGYMISLAWQFKEKKVLFGAVVLILLSLATNLTNLFILPTILSAVERQATVSELLATIIGFVVATMLISAANTYINSNTAYGRITVRSHILNMIGHKSAVMSYCNFLDAKFLDTRRIARGATSNNHSATEAIWGTLISILSSFLCFIVYALMMTALNPFLLLIVLLTTTISYLVDRYTSGHYHRHIEEWAEHNRRYAYSNRDVNQPQYAKDTRLFDLRPCIDELRECSIQDSIKLKKRANAVELVSTATGLLTTFLRNGIAYIYLIGMVLNDGMSVSEFAFFFGTVTGVSGYVSRILSNFAQLHEQNLDICHVREVLEYPEVFKFEDGKPLQFDINISHTITLEEVNFTYPNAESPTLENINMTLHPGEKLAIVGLNGAGKTTLVNILCGFLDPTRGRVLLDGIDIREYDRRDYYNLFTALFQHHFILAGSMALNISQSAGEIDMGKVKQCAEKAGIAQKIESLPNGYDTNLNRDVYLDATELSGGEIQKLLLARALYKNAPFLVLDEPTAALDPIAESEMYQKYNEISRERSSVYISHRLASTRFCDRIILLDGKSIAEEGTHEELIAKNGRYAELFAVQSKYYKEGGQDNEKE